MINWNIAKVTGWILLAFAVFVVLSANRNDGIDIPSRNNHLDDEFFVCIDRVRLDYDNFWSNFNSDNYDDKELVEHENEYEREKVYCYMKYHSYFQLWGDTMTDKQIYKKVEEYEEYTRPRLNRLFESASIEAKIKMLDVVYKNRI